MNDQRKVDSIRDKILKKTCTTVRESGGELVAIF